MSKIVPRQKENIKAMELLEKKNAQLEANQKELQSKIEYLTEYKERYNSIFERSSDVIFLYDLNGNFIEASPSIFQVTGYTPEELKVLNIAELLNSEQLLFATNSYLDLIKGKIPYSSWKYDVRRKDGQIIQLECRSSLVLKDGKPFSIQGTGTDITKKEENEAEVKRSEEKYRMIVEQASDGIFITDEKGNYIEVNSSACHLTGYSKDELLKLNVFDIISKEDLPVNYPKFELLNSGLILTYERKLKKKNGTVFEAEISTSTLTDNRKQAIVRDISERKKIEEKLRISEEKFFKAFSTSPNISFVTRLKDGKIIEVNNIFLREMNTKREDIIGKTTLQLKIWEDVSSRDYVINMLKERGSLKNYETRLRIPFPKTRDYLVFSEYFDIAGEGYCIIAVVDITETKKFEHSLKLAKEKYQTIFNNALEGLFQISVDGKIISANDAFIKMFGYKNLYDIMNNVKNAWSEIGLNNESLNNIFYSLTKNDQVKGLELKIKKRDGDNIWVLLSVRTSIDNITGTKLYEGNVVDITARKYAEEALKESEERLQLSIEGANEGIWDINTKNNVSYFSAKCYTMLGYMPNEFPINLEKLKSLFSSSRGKVILNYVIQTINENDQFMVEVPVNAKSGEKKWLLCKGKVFGRDENGIPLRLVGTLTDITKDKIYEEKLKQSEEKLRALTDHLEKIRIDERKTIAHIVHDELGQSLTAVKMMARSIKKNLDKDQVKLIKKADEMADIVSDTIKTVQKLTAKLRPGLIDTIGLIAAMEWQVELVQSNSSKECIFEVDKKLKNAEFDHISTSAIYDVFRESLMNSIRHSQANKIMISFYIENKNIFLIIMDDGIGITKEQKSLSNSFGIIGMREHVKNIGGKLTIEGSPVKGTVVTLKISLEKIFMNRN